MKGLFWRLPLLRRVPSLQRGFCLAAGMVFGASLAIELFDAWNISRLSHQALSDIAQIGATLLVAYAVETSWFVKHFRGRGSEHEYWVGFVAGVGACGAVGIALAVGLLGHDESIVLDPLEHLAVSWSAFSISLLAGIVAMLPYVLYEWTHDLRTDYPDE